MLGFVVFSVIVRMALKRFRDVPDGFQNVVEALVEAFDAFVETTAGPKLNMLGNWYFMIFSFILVSNIAGIFGLRSPTADWSMTFACALSTFAAIQIIGWKFRGFGYIKSFFEPNPLLFPLNIIGELSRPVSLSFRLFGNVLSGTIIVSLIYSVAPLYLQLGVPAALNVYFDLVTGAIQTYIFCVLSLSFIGAATVDNHASDSAELPVEIYPAENE